MQRIGPALGAALKLPSFRRKEWQFANRNQRQCLIGAGSFRGKLAILRCEVKTTRRRCAWGLAGPALGRVRGGFASQHRIEPGNVTRRAKLCRNTWVAEHARQPRQRFQVVGASRLRGD